MNEVIQLFEILCRFIKHWEQSFKNVCTTTQKSWIVSSFSAKLFARTYLIRIHKNSLVFFSRKHCLVIHSTLPLAIESIKKIILIITILDLLRAKRNHVPKIFQRQRRRKHSIELNHRLVKIRLKTSILNNNKRFL